MGSSKRLKKFIKDDRPLKLKSFLISHDLKAKKVKLSHGRSLLHYCAEFGSPEMMSCLLTMGCDPGHQDNAGRLPLHCAIYRALEEDVRCARETYADLICPLLESFPIGKDVEDLDHKTGQELMSLLARRLKSVTDSEREKSKAEDKEKYEREWRQRIAQEHEFEIQDEHSRYNLNDDFEDEETQETFSAWNDRMRREYCRKQGSKNPSVPQRDPRSKRRQRTEEPQDGATGRKVPKGKSKMTEEEENLKEAREEMRKRYQPPPSETISERLISRKKLYEAKFSRFSSQLHCGKHITFGNVPWPCSHMDQLTEVLFCDLKDRESSDFKSYLKVQRVRWHPDKFSQKFGNHLHSEHVDKIMARVNTISQTLNSFGS